MSASIGSVEQHEGGQQRRQQQQEQQEQQEQHGGGQQPSPPLSADVSTSTSASEVPVVPLFTRLFATKPGRYPELSAEEAMQLQALPSTDRFDVAMHQMDKYAHGLAWGKSFPPPAWFENRNWIVDHNTGALRKRIMMDDFRDKNKSASKDGRVYVSTG